MYLIFLAMRILKISLFSCSVLLLVMISGCKSGVDAGYIEAAIYELGQCSTTPNYEGTDVYGYRGDGFFFVPSIQAGGHTPGESADLGVNFFALSETDLMNRTTYTINNGGGQAGTAYVYYQPTNSSSNEFISTGTSGTLTIIEILLESASGSSYLEPTALRYEISDFEVENIYSGEQRCIMGFKFEATDGLF